MITLVTIIHVIVAFFLMLTILLQSGKGGGVGAAFGGASQAMFGGHGAGSFLAKITSGLAITFFLTSFGLSMMSAGTSSVIGERITHKTPQENPVLGGTEASTDAKAAKHADAGSDAAKLPLPATGALPPATDQKPLAEPAKAAEAKPADKAVEAKPAEKAAEKPIAPAAPAKPADKKP